MQLNNNALRQTVRKLMSRLFALIAGIGVGLAVKSTLAACLLGMVNQAPLLHFAAASATNSAVPAKQVRVTYIGHSSFLIETPGGASAVTDYNGIHVPATAPDIVTMNNSHDSHYTDNPNPEIRFTLRGWSEKIGGGLRPTTFVSRTSVSLTCRPILANMATPRAMAIQSSCLRFPACVSRIWGTFTMF